MPPEDRFACQCYLLGLLSDRPRKNCDWMADAVQGASSRSLQQFITDTRWDPEAMDELRIELMTAQACEGDGVLVVDDTGLPKQGQRSGGRPAVLGHVGQSGQLPDPRHLPLRRPGWGLAGGGAAVARSSRC